jgi:hypothetical protein
MHDGDAPRDRPGGPADPAAAPDAPNADGLAGDQQEGFDLQSLARDWITLWQSELVAIAVDRESLETWETLFPLWAGIAGALLQRPPLDGSDGAAGVKPARHGVSPRPAPAAAASDPRDAEVGGLARRLAELERRLAAIERGAGGLAD